MIVVHIKSSSIFSFFTPIILILIGFLNCEKSPETSSDIVAKINDEYEVSFAELHKHVYDELYHRRFRTKEIGFQQAINDMVTDQLKSYEFFEMGLNGNTELMQNIQRSINEELIVELFKSHFLNKYTNETLTLAAYAKMGEQVYYQKAVLAKPLKKTQKQNDSLQEIAVEIKTKIENGIDFRKALQEYAAMPNLDFANTSTTWEESLSDPVNNVVFDLRVGDTRVLNGDNAFYVVKVMDRKALEVKPFDDVKVKIKEKLEKAYYTKSMEDYERAKNAAVDEEKIEWNEDVLDELIDWSKIPDFYVEMYKDTLKNAISNGNNKTILAYSDGTVDYQHYLRLTNEILIPLSSKSTKKKQLKKFLIDALRTEKMVEKAKSLGLESKVFNSKISNPILKSKIAELFNQAVIDTQIPEPTSDNLLNFYNSNKDSLYHLLDKVNIYTIIYDNKNEAEKAMRKINEGIAFEDITGRYYVKTFIRERNGEIKTMGSSEYPYLGDTAFKMDLNETSGPIKYEDTEAGTQYAIIKCVHIRPEKQLQYREVERTIVEDFRSYHQEKISKKVRNQLWKKYDIQIFEDVIANRLNSES